MKAKWVIAAGVVAGILALPVQASHEDYDDDTAQSEVFFERARVVDVRPIIELVRVPAEHRECWTEHAERGRYRTDPGAAIVVGGVIGGVVGHEIGRGHKKGLATAAGAMIGAAVGHNIARRSYEPYTEDERHCRVREDYYEEEHVQGYRVTYRYHGKTFVTRMDREPGEYLRVRVELSPVSH